ncbi:MAG: exodeoxyribonuclease III [Bacteroidetes bacterium]|nr:MAG: exodeoxyribonuclease III [Bacteroidota bacterium]
MKLISWNVNGIRAVAKKAFFPNLQSMNPDILCLQETKARDHQVAELLSKLEGFHLHVNSAERPGYSGTAVLSKSEVLNESKGMGIKEFDHEGRVLRLEYPDFQLVNVYVPNSGSELKRLAYRQDWDKAFFRHLKELEKTKPVVVCGDFNVAHHEIDLARPKPNYNKSAGYMQEEIDGMDRYIEGGLTDSFRHLHPTQKGAYSWWSYRAGARARNVGWRIDYFLLSKSLLPVLEEACIYSEVMGSDHCPVGITLS